MQRITDHIYAVPGLSMGRIYVITGRSGLAVVDSSYSPKTIHRLAPQLQHMGFDLGDIRDILITHAHPDHIGGLVEMQRHTPNARTSVHFRDAPVARGESAPPSPPPEDVRGLWRLMARLQGNPPMTYGRVDCELQDGDRLDHILPGLQVVALHGHSPGQVGYWWPEQRVLIGGDVMMHVPWGLTLPIAAYTFDMADARRSLHKAAGMGVDILCLGHGKPLIGDAAAHIRALAAKIKP